MFCAGVQAQNVRHPGGNASRRPGKHLGGRENMLAMKSFFITWRARLEREEGQALVEYALILGLISVVAIAVLQVVGTDITKILGSVTSALASALPK
jgi:pilus assembly protein Flp/PilA